MRLDSLEYPYSEDWDYGYIYTDHKNHRAIIKLYRGEKRYSTLYARYLLAVKLGRYLTATETVDHIDNDPTNDDVDNLQILTRDENTRKYNEQREPLKHGTVQCYRRGCRCDACKEVNRIAQRRYKKNSQLRAAGLLINPINPRIEARKLIGRKLKYNEVVHFLDGNKYNIDINNLVVFASRTDYNRFVSYGCDMQYAEKRDDGVYTVKSLCRSSHCPSRLVEFECELCHKKFKAHPEDRRGDHIFCSKACASIYQGAHWPDLYAGVDLPIGVEKVHVEPDQLIKDMQELRSYTAVATKYGLTANAIKKKCIKYGLQDKIQPIIDANLRELARQNNPGTAMPKEQREHLRAISAERWATGKMDQIKKPVEAYNKETGEFVARYDSIGDAERAGFFGSKVSACCKGRIPSYKGYIWKYVTVNKDNLQ